MLTMSPEREKPIGDLPEGAAEAIESMDTIKVEALVQEFLAAQSLKVLPQAPFGDAVNQFVSKDDKHAMETFVSESLAGQVKNLLSLDADEDDLDSAMERVRAKLDAQFAAGQLKLARKRKYKPKPDEWDSDLDGHWEDHPEALVNGGEEEATAPSTIARPRGRAARTVNDDEDDDDVLMHDAEEEEEQVRKAPAKRGAAARTTKAVAAKKAPATAKKPPARGRKKVVEDDDDEDMFVEQDGEEDEAPSRPAPKRSQPARSTAKTARQTKQTKLNFSQSQKSAAGATQQKALEISDDEISEDDDFETMPTTRSRKR
jgi:double-strand break repair protein MRE11